MKPSFQITVLSVAAWGSADGLVLGTPEHQQSFVFVLKCGSLRHEGMFY